MEPEPRLEPQVMQAVEALDYRVTVGDVAAQAGLSVSVAEQGLLALASAVGGHLQVAETGDVAYLFPRQFRAILLQRFWRWRLRRWLGQVWKILFYLIRISFGIVLILSIAVLAIALIVAAIPALAAASSRDDNDSGGSIKLDGLFHFVGDVLGGALRLLFYADWLGWGGYGYGSGSGYGAERSARRPPAKRSRSDRQGSDLNFLEAIFSFLFGDGNPNGDLEERRWQLVAQTIRQQRGAIAAEQVLPFLDETSPEADDAILPVLTRFQGQPQVSPQGDLVYQFPELQVSARDGQSSRSLATLPGGSNLQGNNLQGSPNYLQERPWRFSRAGAGQLWGAAVLGVVNAGLAIAVGLMLPDFAASGIGFLVFVAQIYPLLLVYGLGFLLIPLIRWQVVKGRDRAVQRRNHQRQAQAQTLQQPDAALQAKLAYAQQFAQHQQLRPEDATYSTETDLIEQEIDQQAQLDEAWQRRLESET